MEWLYSGILSTVLTSIIMLLLLRKLGKDLSEGIGGFIESINEMFAQPMVKRAMSFIGRKGGDALSQKNLANKVASGYIKKNYGALKMLGEQVLGIDVDDMIEEYGAENILAVVQKYAPQLGLMGEKKTSGLP